MREPDVESGGEACGDLVVAAREDHLIAVDGILVEPVRVKIPDPRTALLLNAMTEELADLVDALRVETGCVEGAFGDIQVGIAGGGARDLGVQCVIDGRNVVDPAGACRGRHRPSLAVEVHHRASAGLKTPDRVLQRGDAQRLH